MKVRSSLEKNRVHLSTMSTSSETKEILAAYSSLLAGLGLPLAMRTKLAQPPSKDGWRKLAKVSKSIMAQVALLPDGQRQNFEALLAAETPAKVAFAAEAIANSTVQNPFTADFAEGYRQSLRAAEILHANQLATLNPFNPQTGSSAEEAEAQASTSGAAADGATLGAAIGGTAGAAAGGLLGAWPGAGVGAGVGAAVGGLAGAVVAAIFYVVGSGGGSPRGGDGGEDDGEGEGPGGENPADGGGGSDDGGEQIRASGSGVILFEDMAGFANFEEVNERGFAREGL